MGRTRIERDYEAVCRRLAADGKGSGMTDGFYGICRDMGAAAVAVDNLMYERLGMSGEEVLQML